MAATNLSEFYKAQGKALPSLEERAKTFEQSGLGSASDYIAKNKAGDIAPNTALLGFLSKSQPGGTPDTAGAAPTPQVGAVAGTSDAITTAEREAETKKIQDEIAAANKLRADREQAEIDKIRASITPTTLAPAAPQLTAKFEELRTAQGVLPIEEEITGFRSQKADLIAQLSSFRAKEPVGVTAGFAAGRISEEERNIQERVDFITRQENNAIDRLNFKNKYIENVMKLTGDDYDNAVSRYDRTLAQNIQTQTAIQNYKTAQQAEENRQRDDSRAYLTSVSNLIQNSGKKWDDIDNGMRADINKAELKAGYATGTLEAFARAKPKANLVGSTSGYDAKGDAITTLIYDDGLGGLKTAIVRTGGVKEVEGGVGGPLRTVESIKARLVVDPNISRANLQAEMDRDKTLTQESITRLLDEAGVFVSLPEAEIADTIEGLKDEIKEEAQKWTVSGASAKKAVIDKLKSSMIVSDSESGKTYRLTEDILSKITSKL